MTTPRVLLCMGTRPEIIKMAPVYGALRAVGLDADVAHTGQHSDMAQAMYDFFGIKPAFEIELTRARPGLAHLSARLLDELGDVLERERPDAVLVHGDTSSTLSAALAAYYSQIPVAHVEAGLRTHQMYDPFPEEKNRELAARLATWHFCPTQAAAGNLMSEGIPATRIHVTGNTVVDAAALGLSKLRSGEACAAMPWTPAPDERLVVVTAHRRENLGAPLDAITDAVKALLCDHPELRVLWPVHANPEVRTRVMARMATLPPALASRVHLVAPLDYPDMLRALSDAWLLLTDSGGLQEEAVSLNVPVLILRDTTERPEVLSCGAGRLVGTDIAVILHAVSELRQDPVLHARMRTAANPFGHGDASEQIATILATHFINQGRPLSACLPASPTQLKASA